jgi:hypothetical protein
VLLLVALLTYLGALEFATRVVLPRYSELLQRQTGDRRAALEERPLMTGGSKSVLLVGNSLLVAGIKRPELREGMGPAYHVVLYPIESTDYLDWFFGLRRLFAEGARPNTVVLTLDQFQMLSDATQGEEFAYSLMQLRDLAAVVRAGRLDTMTASAYFFANFSALLGRRAHLRNGLMSRWLPNASLLAGYITNRRPSPVDASHAAVQRVVDRLQRVRQLCSEYHTGFVYLVPASPNRSNPAPYVKALAGVAGIQVLIPYSPGEMPDTAFSDRYHLNPDGAALFTDRVARALAASVPPAGK